MLMVPVLSLTLSPPARRPRPPPAPPAAAPRGGETIANGGARAARPAGVRFPPAPGAGFRRACARVVILATWRFIVAHAYRTTVFVVVVVPVDTSDLTSREQHGGNRIQVGAASTGGRWRRRRRLVWRRQHGRIIQPSLPCKRRSLSISAGTIGAISCRGMSMRASSRASSDTSQPRGSRCLTRCRRRRRRGR